jgi:8-oxo-dGTP pyrophosphatase MutT (NUDIX family)
MEPTETIIISHGQRWRQRWHPAGEAPEGKRNGSAGICLTGDGDVVLISSNNLNWDLPGGRPEGDEDWEETLRREVLEEACATVEQARLLGFAQGCHVDGPEAGRWMVRSIWLAKVTLHPWQPLFETKYRKEVPFNQAADLLLPEFSPLWGWIFDDARVHF